MSQDNGNTPVSKHREFWENGYHVFGLHGADKKGQCGCGNPDCQAAYKHPLVSNWQHTPHWSEDQLEVMEEVGQVATGYGVLIRGMLVIDVDARNAGVASMEMLFNDYPSLKNCGLVVKTGSGGGSRHFYYKLPAEIALVQHLEQYPGIDFKSSGFVVGPGSLHASGNRYEISFGSIEEIEEAPEDIIALLRKPDRHRAVIDGPTVDTSQGELAEMLSFIDPDTDHDTWVKCGMATHHASNGTALGVWDTWSAKGSKYPVGGNYQDVRDVASKIADNAARLAALIHVFEGNEGPISKNAFDGAEAIVQWHLDESCRFFNEVSMSPELANAVRVERWLVKMCQHGAVTSIRRNVIRQKGPVRDLSALNAAISELVKLGRIRNVKDGRTEIVVINPHILNSKTN